MKWGLNIISLFNKRNVLCGKLAAQVILKPFFWAQIVSAKYKFPGTWYQYKKSPSYSYIWIKIMGFGRKIIFYFIWRTGLGGEDYYFR